MSALDYVYVSCFVPPSVAILLCGDVLIKRRGERPLLLGNVSQSYISRQGAPVSFSQVTPSTFLLSADWLMYLCQCLSLLAHY